MPLQPGDRVGSYTIIEQIGQGGMATVYRAHHAKLDRQVAIKMLHQNFLEDTGLLARFEREARIIANLDHPHIVPIYDYDEANGQPYLVMRLIEGVTLKEILAADTLPLAVVLHIMTAVADGLQYAHSKNVLHRDIKPSNILIDANEVPYLTDFGLARIIQAGESTLSAEMMLGTPHYISPEQAKGDRDLNGCTDVYSLGVILYELMVGRVPFSGDTPYAIVHHHIYSAPPRPSDINPEIPQVVEAVLLRALAKDPANRYQTPNDLMAAFQTAVGDSRLEKYKADKSLAAPTPQPQRAAPESAIQAPIVRGNRKYVTVGQIDTGQIDLGDMGRRMGDGVKRGAGFLGNFIAQVEAASIRYANASRKQPPSEEELIRERIEKHYQARQGFLAHLAVFILINGMFWALWGTADEWITTIPDLNDWAGRTWLTDFMWPLVIMIPWLIGLIVHWISYNVQHGGGARRREREIHEAIQQSRQMRAYYEAEHPEKAKHELYPDDERNLRLTADGELSESFAEEWSARRGRGSKRHRR